MKGGLPVDEPPAHFCFSWAALTVRYSSAALNFPVNPCLSFAMNAKTMLGPVWMYASRKAVQSSNVSPLWAMQEMHVETGKALHGMNIVRTFYQLLGMCRTCEQHGNCVCDSHFALT
eukprot:scaffold54911_cov18-Tisochrysis_lutea.AAC.2